MRCRSLQPLVFFAACLPLVCCHSRGSDSDACTGYPDWKTSAWVLPYPVGMRYRVAQGNCSPPLDGHRGTEKYAYDFDMPIGTPFVAIRAGVAVHIEASHRDGQIAEKGLDNFIVIRHNDGTFALYAHLTHDGAVPTLHQRVDQGQVIGRSGNSGNTNDFPHLHVALHICDPVENGSQDCPTWPIAFRNTDPNPNGLQRGHFYEAVAY